MEIWIDAPPEKVYRYLVERELTVRWFGEESWNEPQAGSLYRVSVGVEWDLEAVDGGTRVRLRHGGLTEDGVERHSEGWGHFEPELAKAAAA